MTQDTREGEAISADAFAAQFNACRAPAPFAIAVSGGPDSMTLMRLAARHCKKARLAAPLVLTVDHRLRAESAAEAQMVAAAAEALGLVHETLVWHGPHPRQNIQHMARMARYALIGAAMRKHNLWALMTGHTLDDQAETFLLRLARGSGLDGLSGMAEFSGFPLPTYPDLCVLRPLLGFTKSQVLATARALRISFVDDPSNRNAAFARTRAREALSALKSTGVTPHRIAEASRHLRRARLAIEQIERAVFAQAVTLSPWGCAVIDREPLRDAPHEVGLRVTASLLRLAGGALYPPELETIEGVYAWLLDADPKVRGRTAGGCRLAILDNGQVLAAREQAALEHDEPVLLLQPGQSGIWDGRFRITVPKSSMVEQFAVHALGGLSQSAMKLSDFPPAQHEPRRIAATYPGVFDDGVLVAVPRPPAKDMSGFTAEFLGRMPAPTDT